MAIPPEREEQAPRPLVFISCGQFTDQEKRLGENVRIAVETLAGCQGYFAENQNSLDGLSQNIFGALNLAAGFIAIMHHRGQVNALSGPLIRGSVWVEQEIAIAAFVQSTQSRALPVLLYLQKGIQREGVRQQLILRPFEFEKDEEVVADVIAQIKSGAFAPRAVLHAKKTRSAAEQHQFEIAEKAITKLGPVAETVLQHLRICGKYASGHYSPPPPPGLNGNQMREMLAKLVDERLVRYDITNHVIDERTYELVPGMVPVLDELLYH
jgi:hypothetical protein